MTAKEVSQLFERYRVTDYLNDYFEPLHTQGHQWLVAEIDEFINTRKEK